MNETSLSAGFISTILGVFCFVRYWLSRPDRFGPSFYMVDDAVVSSTIAETIIQANMGEIKRQAAISFQGGTCTLSHMGARRNFSRGGKTRVDWQK